MEKKKLSFGARLKESLRKMIVTLKHKPHMIPMVMLVITFLYYSLHLTTISNTTAKIQGPNMGLCGFAIMLILMFAMLAIIFTADIAYINAITSAVFREENPIVVTQTTAYIAYAQYYLQVHMILLGISVALIVLLPVYSKLIRKIRTSIEVEDTGNMEVIDISGEN